MSELSQLISTRGNFRGQVNTIYADRDNFPQKTKEEKLKTTEKVKRLRSELQKLDPLIRDLKWQINSKDLEKAKSENDAEITLSTSYEDKILEILLALPVIRDDQSSRQALSSMLRSPTAPLPSFTSKDGEDLIKFFGQFEETTQRFNFSDYDKFLLLKQQISGRALSLLNNLDTTDHSYEIAKELLLAALASPVNQKFNVIKQMASLKLEQNSEPFEYIGKVNSIYNSAKNLKISTDDILQYFTWTGLNENFKTHLTNITNETKPSIEKIKEHFFEASERYVNSNKYRRKEEPYRKETSSSAFAVDANFKESVNIFKYCTLCKGKSSTHSTNKCLIYPNPESKVDRLRILGGCVRCAGTNHSLDNCKFYFRRLCDCGERHFTFLCTKPKKPSGSLGKASNFKPPPKPIPVKKSESNSNLASLEYFADAFEASDCSRAILPTFSCNLEGGPMRCMRDGGCQSNFILESRAMKENLPVVQTNIKLKVNGFNSSQIYHSNCYKVRLTIGGECYEVEAIGVPQIRTNLVLPGLQSVARTFVDKGYMLADKFLQNGKDIIDDIEFILASNSAYCLTEKMISFGGSEEFNPSVYSETAAGIMLLGNVDQLEKNLVFLPHITDLGISQLVTCKDLGLQTSSGTLSPSNLELQSIEADIAIQEVWPKENAIEDASAEGLEEMCSDTLGHDKQLFPDESVEDNERIVDYILKNTTQNEDGRLVMPLIWNNKVSHLLGENKQLATKILESNLRKLGKNGENLKMVDDYFKEQVDMNLVERIENFENFMEENPNHSFMAHMPIFKPDRETTKCRIVFLSNLREKNADQPVTLSHNQAMLSGPNLNQKITSALLHLRFDQFLLCFDVKKAFLNICLHPSDANKLMFLWYRNVEKADFSIVAYRSIRLPFGLVCSPCLLMLGLYKILILDSEEDDKQMKLLKRRLYSLFYMDNGSITFNTENEIKWAFKALGKIFEPYKFYLQQYVTNYQGLQNEIDKDLEESTPEEVKLMGLQWNRLTDTLSTRPLKLDHLANTKRLILKTIASHFDIFGFTGPILNRARIFLHSLQCDRTMLWDDKLSESQFREWTNICKQVNSAPGITVNRFVGEREGSYRLIAFTDSSKDLYGAVIFIQELKSKKVSFVMAKNRMINRQLSGKSIPSLEFQAIAFGTEVLIDLYKELAGSSCLCPIDIVDLELYSDSMVSLAWINSYVHKLDKRNKRSIFILNRLEYIERLCEVHPIKFQFASGIENPADLITRPTSHRMLQKSTYFTGPEFLLGTSDLKKNADILEVTVPNPLARSFDSTIQEDIHVGFGGTEESDHLGCVSKCSDFFRLISRIRHVLTFVKVLKAKLYLKNPQKYEKFKPNNDNLFNQARDRIIIAEQKKCFADVFNYFESRKSIKEMPNIIRQLNVYPDKFGILRVKSKFARWKDDEQERFPVLLPKDSDLTRLIIMSYHKKYLHAGCYRLLAELRKQFWIPKYFSIVKNALKSCIICRQVNQRTLKLNVSPYRDFRLQPSNIPFRYIFIDHMGPYFIKNHGKKKVWILCITCLWTRAINLKICLDLSTKEFIRSLQLHSFEYGIPELCLSDLGSSFVAGGNKIEDFLKDHDVHSYLEEQGIKPLKFEQYPKGCHQLGGLVETCVKMVKKLLRCTLRSNVLDFREFEFVVAQAKHMVNRRPVAFIEGLRESKDIIPDPITPERLIHGFDLVSVNLISELNPIPEDPDWNNTDPVSVIQDSYSKLRKVRQNLYKTYNSEFINHLMKQALNDKNRYTSVTHHGLQEGDIVLVKEENCKPINFPMAIVIETKRNINNEVTEAVLRKGNTREIIRRHVSSLVPILTSKDKCPAENAGNVNSSLEEDLENSTTSEIKKQRKAAARCASNTKQLVKDGLI